MLCKIADLIVEVPETEDLYRRCKDYIWSSEESADIIIRTDLFHPEHWPGYAKDMMFYMESGSIFYANLLYYNGLRLHASAIEVDGKAYLFSGPSGMGKSTHTRLWRQEISTNAQVFNDDKPAIRFVDDVWYAYGTPWCGKDAINQNKKVCLAGICFLKQAAHNKIRLLNKQEAMHQVIDQTYHNFMKMDKLDIMLTLVDKLVREIPVFELENRPEPEAAQLSYETMSRKAKEMGL